MANIRRCFMNGKTVDLPVWEGKNVFALYYNGYCIWKNGMDYNFITKWNLDSQPFIFPAIEEIGNKGFINWNDKNKDYEYDSSLTYSHNYENGEQIVSIQCDITNVKDKAFIDLVNDENISRLTYIEIPETIESIGESAFKGCSLLSQVYINGSNLTEIKNNSFYKCSSLFKIVIPETVNRIGSSSFCYCEKLRDVSSLPNVSYIGDSAFYRCSSLTGFTFSDKLTYIGSYAFAHCSKLLSIIKIPSGVKSILRNTFYFCKEITSVIFEDNGVETIEDEAFENCTQLVSVKFGNSLKVIGYSAFGFCSKLSNFVLPDTIESIGQLAFNACYNLSYVEIPSSIKNIDSTAFFNCTNIKTIRIHKPVDSIPNAPWGAGDYTSGSSDTVVIWD